MEISDSHLFKRLMRAALSYEQEPQVRKLLPEITANIEPKDYLAEIDGVVRVCAEFDRDPADRAAFMAGMLMALGNSCSFAQTHEPGKTGRTVIIVELPGRRLVLDPLIEVAATKRKRSASKDKFGPKPFSCTVCRLRKDREEMCGHDGICKKCAPKECIWCIQKTKK